MTVHDFVSGASGISPFTIVMLAFFILFFVVACCIPRPSLGLMVAGGIAGLGAIATILWINFA